MKTDWRENYAKTHRYFTFSLSSAGGRGNRLLSGGFCPPWPTVPTDSNHLHPGREPEDCHHHRGNGAVQHPQPPCQDGDAAVLRHPGGADSLRNRPECPLVLRPGGWGEGLGEGIQPEPACEQRDGHAARQRGNGEVRCQCLQQLQPEHPGAGAAGEGGRGDGSAQGAVQRHRLGVCHGQKQRYLRLAAGIRAEYAQCGDESGPEPV